MVLVAAASEGLRLTLIATAFGFGFRHGIDWDHLAAITDITSSQESPRRSMTLATLYALGHAIVVFGLGLGAILLGEQLPRGIDHAMERVVGATLILLGVYVFVALVRNGRDFRMRSRWMLLFAGMRRGARWVRRRRSAPHVVVIEHDHEHPVSEPHLVAERVTAAAGRAAPTMNDGGHHHTHRHIAVAPEDPFVTYGNFTALLVGMIHGIGAETPTQILIFLAAAQAEGKAAGVALLGAFLAGLLVSNSSVALASTFGFRGASRNFGLYVAVSVVAAVGSLVIGSLFLFGRGAVLPAIFSG